MFLHYLVKLENYNCCPILIASCTRDMRIYLARYVAVVIAQLWIIWLQNVENNAAVLRRGSAMSANWNSRWLTCSLCCSRLSLMKLAPVNGVNVCQLVLVPEMDVFVTCCNFRTMYQVGGLQWVFITKTAFGFWRCWSRLLHKLPGVCHQNIFSRFLRYPHSVLHMLQRN